jgi:hypothetical protein
MVRGMSGRDRAGGATDDGAGADNVGGSRLLVYEYAVPSLIMPLSDSPASAVRAQRTSGVCLGGG